MNFRRIKIIFKKDLLDLVRTRPRLIAIFLFPLLMIFFFGSGFSGQITGADALVVGENVNNLQGAGAAKQLESAMKMAGKRSDLFDFTVNDEISRDEAVDQMEQGKYDAIIFIPQGFPSKNVEVLVNPARSQLTRAAIERGVEKMVGKVTGGLPPVEASKEYGDLEYIDFLAPAIIVMTIFFGAGQGTGRSLAGEKEEGTLDRLAMTPASANDIVGGKTLYSMVTQLIRGIIIVLAVILLFHVTMNGSWFLVGTIILLMTAASVGIGLALSALAEDESTYAEMSMMVILPAIFVTGIFFPVSAMPSWIQPISYIYPLTYANNAIRQVMLLGTGLRGIGHNLLILTFFAVGLYLFGAWLFNRTARR